MCYVAAVKCLPIHRYSVAMWTNHLILWDYCVQISESRMPPKPVLRGGDFGVLHLPVSQSVFSTLRSLNFRRISFSEIANYKMRTIGTDHLIFMGVLFFFFFSFCLFFVLFFFFGGGMDICPKKSRTEVCRKKKIFRARVNAIIRYSSI